MCFQALMLALLMVLGACGPEGTKAGLRELQALKQDPFWENLPGNSELLRKEEKAATDPDWLGVSNETRISRSYSMKGKPGGAVLKWVKRASDAGWHRTGTNCSQSELYTRIHLDKTTSGISAGLSISVYLPDEDGFGPTTPELRVEMWPAKNGPRVRPPASGMTREDVHCIDNLKDQDLRPTNDPPRSDNQMCALVPLASIQTFVPEVVRLGPTSNSEGGCAYLDSEGERRLATADVSRNPRAFYEDDQHSGHGETDKVFLLGRFHAEPVGAWIATSSGPVRLAVEGAPIAEDKILGLAHLFATAPVPPPTSPGDPTFTTGEGNEMESDRGSMIVLREFRRAGIIWRIGTFATENCLNVEAAIESSNQLVGTLRGCDLAGFVFDGSGFKTVSGKVEIKPKAGGFSVPDSAGKSRAHTIVYGAGVDCDCTVRAYRPDAGVQVDTPEKGLFWFVLSGRQRLSRLEVVARDGAVLATHDYSVRTA